MNPIRCKDFNWDPKIQFDPLKTYCSLAPGCITICVTWRIMGLSKYGDKYLNWGYI